MRCCFLDWYVCRTYFDLYYFEVLLWAHMIVEV